MDLWAAEEIPIGRAGSALTLPKTWPHGFSFEGALQAYDSAVKGGVKRDHRGGVKVDQEGV